MRPKSKKPRKICCALALERFQPALIRPSPKWLDEDYLVIDIQSANHDDGRPPTAEELLRQYGDQITQLVRGELTPLSATERDEILRGALSYYPTDLIVVGWAAALVYDKPDATSAIIDLLEYANTQLLEFATTTKCSPASFRTSIARWRAAKAFFPAGACPAAPAA